METNLQRNNYELKFTNKTNSLEMNKIQIENTICVQKPIQIAFEKL